MTAGGTQPVMNDVIAVVTAAIADDDELLYELVGQLADPEAVIVGLAGFISATLPEYARTAGIEDLPGAWAAEAVAMAALLAAGERP